MIGPGPSPKAWSVGWCMALVYFSTANPALHSFLQTSRAELEEDECEQCDGASWRLMFNKPLSLHSTLIWKYEAARVERGLLAGANLSFSLRPCLPQLSSQTLILNPKQNERGKKMTVRGLKREGEREKTEIGLLVCCALLCCEHVIRLKMSLVQSGTPRQRGIVGIYVCALMRCTHNFGGLKELNHSGVCWKDLFISLLLR